VWNTSFGFANSSSTPDEAQDNAGVQLHRAEGIDSTTQEYAFLLFRP